MLAKEGKKGATKYINLNSQAGSLCHELAVIHSVCIIFPPTQQLTILIIKSALSFFGDTKSLKWTRHAGRYENAGKVSRKLTQKNE